MKKFDLLLDSFLIIIVGFVFILWYWFLVPYHPLDIEQPVEIVNKKVAHGEVVLAKFNFTKYTDVTPDVSLALVDGVIFNVPKFSPQNQMGDVKDRVVGVLEIPKTVPCGEYHFEWTASYQMNPIRRVEVKYQSEKFLVEDDTCVREPIE